MPSMVPLLLALRVSVEMPLEPADQEILLQACSKALASEPCEESPTKASQLDTWGALVREVDPNTVFVSVRRGTRKLETELTFDEEDAHEERARSIGLAIGLLGATFSREQPPAAPAASAEMPLLPLPLYPIREGWENGAPAPLIASRWEARTRPIGSFVSVNGVFEVEPGWGAFGAGGGLLGGQRLVGALWGTLGAHIVHFPTQGEPFHLTTITCFAGPSYALTWPHLDLHLQLQVGGEALLFRSVAPLARALDSRGTGLIRGAVLLGLPLTDFLSLQVSPQVKWSWSPSDVFIGEELAASTFPVRAGVTLGVAFTDRKARRP